MESNIEKSKKEIVDSGIKRYDIYKNIKTSHIYVVDSTPLHSETLEPMVAYGGLNDSTSQWVRPLKLFQEKFIKV